MTFSTNFEQDKPDKNGLAPIYLRVTVNRDHKRINTHIKVRPKDWDKKKKKVKSSELNNAVYNDALNSIKQRVEMYHAELVKKYGEDTFSIDMLISYYENGGERVVYFVDFTEKYIKTTIDRGGWSNSKQYSDFLKKFKGFLRSIERDNIAVAEVKLDVVENFEHYLRVVKNNRRSGDVGLHPNTIYRHMKSFKAIMNKLQKESFIDVNNNPFNRYEMPPFIQTKKESLTEQEIEQIEKTKIPKTSKITLFKDIFLFAYYNSGIRAEDICLLRMSNIEMVEGGQYRFCYQMKKDGKFYNSFLPDQIRSVAAKYWSPEKPKDDFLFPLLSNYSDIPSFASVAEIKLLPIEQQVLLDKKIQSQEARSNKGLKELALCAKIDKNLYFHLSRHTFAKNAFIKGATTDELQAAMNHSDPKVTQHYIGSMGLNSMDKLTTKVFGEGNKSKLLDIIQQLDENQLSDKKVKDILKIIYE